MSGTRNGKPTGWIDGNSQSFDEGTSVSMYARPYGNNTIQWKDRTGRIVGTGDTYSFTIWNSTTFSVETK